MLQNQQTGITVGAIMSQPPLTVGSDSDLREARFRLREHGVHHLFVEDRGRIVGLLSDRDVLRAVSPYADGNSSQRRDDLTLERPVFSIASYDMITVDCETPIEIAAATMLEHNISCLPVTSHAEEVVGIVTTRDLLRATLSCLISDRPAEDAAAA